MRGYARQPLAKRPLGAGPTTGQRRRLGHGSHPLRGERRRPGAARSAASADGRPLLLTPSHSPRARRVSRGVDRRAIRQPPAPSRSDRRRGRPTRYSVARSACPPGLADGREQQRPPGRVLVEHRTRRSAAAFYRRASGPALPTRTSTRTFGRGPEGRTASLPAAAWARSRSHRLNIRTCRLAPLSLLLSVLKRRPQG